MADDTRWTLRHAFRAFVAVLPVLMVVGALLRSGSIEPRDYGLVDVDGALATCVRTEVIAAPLGAKVLRGKNGGVDFDAEDVANVYLPYGVAALNAYPYTDPAGKHFESNGEDSCFTLARYSDEWQRQERKSGSTGLVLDYYYNESQPDVLRLLIAFRGTEMPSARDWLSNFSWFTQFLPVENQYHEARRIVGELFAAARARAQGRKVSMVTTGHSLGGGLAEHIAYAFPCTSAVVFDSSFVVNRHWLAHPFTDAQVVHVYDKHDELTRLRRVLFADHESETYKMYGINLVPKGELQHLSEPFAVGMAGMVAMCQTRSGSDIPDGPDGCRQSDRRAANARRLYCGSHYAAKEQNEPQCKRIASPCQSDPG